MAVRNPRWMVLNDDEHECPYLPGRVARSPLRWPLQRIGPTAFDARLAAGDRRAGSLFYRMECPSCSACEALRVPIARFAPTKSQRRVMRQNEAEVTVKLQKATVTDRHVEIYNRHKFERGLAVDYLRMDPETYRRYYVESGVKTWEALYFVGDRMVAFSVLDVGRKAVSSVYHAFDPDESHRSLGTFSAIREMQLFGEKVFDWYYLGLWVKDCASLSYKDRFHPHQRLAGGVWREFADGAGEGEVVE